MSMLLWSYMDSVLWYKHHTFLQYDRNHNFHAILKLVWCSVTNYGKILHFQRIVFIVVATSWISSLLLMSSDSIQIVAAQFSIWSFNMVITWATPLPNFAASLFITFKITGRILQIYKKFGSYFPTLFLAILNCCLTSIFFWDNVQSHPCYIKISVVVWWYSCALFQ